ncbi:hypothetical protein [Methanosphaera cuniculi]|uniref:Bacterial Ig-like domain-containing protein n=1 Tax=Methanosphaera cuniculi TaxID=1077256 RepID=A0A2A2HBC9_9EURY|nr:hypothetical protein [Methanosphaera cuniculi]PAV06610.1 hypothetical protein ASJ82_04055 [Methanosphaera cuniculi]PWL07798.1 hypothetical protein MSCUN_13290 [Methanosphaera cuniculi]
MTDRIKTQLEANIVESNTKRYTVQVKVTEKGTNKPVKKGKVVITTKKGRLIGKSKVEDGIAEVTSSITKKDYNLIITYEENHKYTESTTKLKFKKQYMFYKTSAYLWASIAIAIIVLIYVTILNTYFLSSISSVINTIAQNSLYLEPTTTIILSSIFKTNMNVIGVIINLLIWILIISFIIAGVYARDVNPKYHSIIRKNVTNHDLFKHFIPIVILILIFITIVEVVLAYII